MTCTFSKRKRELWEDVGEPIDIFGGCSGLSTLLRGKDCCIWANEFHGSDKPITEITWAGRAHDRWGFDIRSGVNCGIEELGQEFLKFGVMLSYEKKKNKAKIQWYLYDEVFQRVRGDGMRQCAFHRGKWLCGWMKSTAVSTNSSYRQLKWLQLWVWVTTSLAWTITLTRGISPYDPVSRKFSQFPVIFFIFVNLSSFLRW